MSSKDKLDPNSRVELNDQMTVLKSPAYACSTCLEALDAQYNITTKFLTLKHRKTRDCKYTEQMVTVPFSTITL